MKRIAPLLLVGLLAVALFQFGPWGGDDGLDRVVDAGDRTAVEAAGDRVADDRTAPAAAPQPGTDGGPARATLDTARIRVVGRLRGPRAEPVVGTEMHLFLGKPAANPFANFGESPRSLPKPSAVAQTDADGSFAFSVPARQDGYIGLGSGDLVWEERPPRFLGSDTDLDLGEIDVQMGAVLSGRVVDERDVPIAGVALRFTGFESFGTHRAAESDRTGVFQLRGLPGGRGYLTVERDGYIGFHEATETRLGKVRDDLLVRLRRGDELMGLVVDDRSQPVAGAEVRVTGNGKSLANGRYEYNKGKAESDAKGNFRVGGLGSDPYRVHAKAPGYLAGNVSNARRVDGLVRVELVRTARVLGRLVDERGAPIAGSRVWASDKEPSDKGQQPGIQFSMKMMDIGGSLSFPNGRTPVGVETDADGRFTVEEIRPGRVWLVASGAHRRAVLGPLQLAPGQEQSGVEVTAERGGVVAVRVTDPDGAPVAKARVQLRKAADGAKPAATESQPSIEVLGLNGSLSQLMASGARGRSIRGETDAEGRVELAGVDAGAYELTAAHDDWVAPAPVAVRMTDKAKVEAAVTMLAGGRVAVRVVDAKGRPVAEQAFRVHLPAAAAPNDRQGRRRAPKSVATGRTDATGRATVGPLAAGDYEVSLELRNGGGGMWGGFLVTDGGGRRQALGDPQPFRVQAGATVELVLTRPKLATLAGTVTDGNGAVTHASMVLRPAPGQGAGGASRTSRERSDGEGRFAFENLQPGRYSLSVVRRQGEPAFLYPVEIQGTDDHHRDVYLNVGDLELVVTLDGKPVAGLKVVLRPAGAANMPNGTRVFGDGAAARPTAVTDAAGKAHYAGLPVDGRFQVRVDSEEYLHPAGEAVEIRSGGTTRHALALAKAARLELSAGLPAGAAATTAVLVQVREVGTTDTRTVWLRGDKSKTLSVPAGRYEVQSQRMGGGGAGRGVLQSEWQPVELRAGEVAKMKVIVP